MTAEQRKLTVNDLNDYLIMEQLFLVPLIE